jgi:hypothetical protein
LINYKEKKPLLPMDDYHFGYKQKLLKRNSAMATIWQPWNGQLISFDLKSHSGNQARADLQVVRERASYNGPVAWAPSPHRKRLTLGTNFRGSFEAAIWNFVTTSCGLTLGR